MDNPSPNGPTPAPVSSNLPLLGDPCCSSPQIPSLTKLKERRNASPAITEKLHRVLKRANSSILLQPSVLDKEETTYELFQRFANEEEEMSPENLRLLLIETYPAASRMNPSRLSAFLNQFFINSTGESVPTINFKQFRALWKQTEQFAVIETGEVVVSKLLESAEAIPSYVEQSLSFRKLERKEILFLEDEQPEFFYTVLSGGLRIYREHEQTIQILDEMGVGATVGDFVLFLKGDKYPFSCCAVRDSTLVAIPVATIKEFMLNNADFYYRIIKHVLISVKRFDHLTLYHNLFGEENDKPPKLQEKIGKSKDLIHWELKDIFDLHWDVQDVPKKVFEELGQILSRKQFPLGSKLCHHRVTSDAFIILKGAVKYVVKTRHKEVVVARKSVGETIGLVSVLCGLNIEASVVAEQDTTVLTFPRKAFEWLVVNYRTLIDEAVETRAANTVNRLKRFNVGYRYLKVSKDTYMCKRGETTQEVFLILTGELEEQKSSMGNAGLMTRRVVNYFGPGDLVGVKSLVSGKPSSTSIRATRTSEVVVFNITKEQLREMVVERPQLFETLLSRKKCKTPVASGMSIAVVPLTPSTDVEEFSQLFIEKVQKLGPTIRLTRADINRNFGISAKATDIPYHLPLWWWTNDLVVKYNYVLYQAESQSPNWTNLAIQQADCVILLLSYNDSDEKHDIALNPILEKSANVHLVLIHPTNFERQLGSFNVQLAERLQRSVTMLHNVIHSNAEDYARVARICTGNAIGLALGGGSCRGLAHLGVIKALKEEGIPIDIIGGTSAGSIVSAFYARDETLNVLANTFVEVFTLSNWVKDFTLPFMSFLSGVEIRKRMTKLFGESKIEDLHIPMFAISTNMHTYKEHMHKKGSLWLAIRSSIALPPFMPPVKTSEGLFLDGGFVNKVPVEFCRGFGARYVIGVDVSFKYHFGATLPDSYTDSSSGFKIILEKLTGGNQYLSVMEIMTELGYLIDNNRKPDERADVFITPSGMDRYGTFTTAKEAPAIIQKGYEEAKVQLQQLKTKDPEKWKRMALCSPVDPDDPSLFIKVKERPLRTKKRFKTPFVVALWALTIIGYRWRNTVWQLLSSTLKSLIQLLFGTSL